MSSLFTTQLPATLAANDRVPYELGMRFQVSKAGKISAIRFYKSAGDTTLHVGRVWSSTGTLLAQVSFLSESTSGWHQAQLAAPLSVQANTVYVVSVNTSGPFPVTLNGFASALTNAEITAPA